MAGRKRSRLDNSTDEAKRHKLAHPDRTPAIRVTRAMDPGVAEAVLMITELLENILLFLPMKDALLAQRVSRKWNAVISESSALQKKLFFLAEETTSRWCFQFVDDDRNCRVTKVDPNAAVDKRGWRDAANHRVTRCVTDVAMFNPLLLRDKRRQTICVVFSAGANLWVPPVEVPPYASYYKMLLTQPPLREATAYHETHSHPRYEYQHQKDQVENEAGLTALDLVTSGRMAE
ncbi:hypothetical protein LTR37_018996 [Vermiconidia calcicola]|uniref:Uncharacterized protein n=1 Tax=Vermiconidia calcicola TaxID=1690605 RepID=A0ACC3MFJ5_9PEZI|nr:hypothetical protein LTR37_018996 [Vermiconidia calcicola]